MRHFFQRIKQAAFLFLLTSQALSARSEATTTRSYQTNFIEGWRVLVDKRLFDTNGPATKKALELLQNQLTGIVRNVPNRPSQNCAT